MDKFLVKEYIGEFFSKMYQANKGKRIDICLQANENRIQVYYKDEGTFDYIDLVDERPSIDGLVKSLSR